ncbi:acyltransferase, partial [Fulvivirga sp.]
MIQLTQFYIRNFRPWLLGVYTRIVYSGSRVEIGKRFRTDSIPRIIVDKGCVVKIGSNVEFRRNIEIRSHGISKIIIGNNVRIDRGVRLLAANTAIIDINEKVRIGLYSVFNGGDSITVGAKSLVSGFVYLQTSMHGFAQKSLSVQEQGYNHAPVVLEQDTWLGTHVVVLPGITIGKGAVVGSNAVVSKNILSYQVVAGIP